jgi:hypothetical protein
MATGDLGAPAYRKFDIEAWMPGLERYGEARDKYFKPLYVLPIFRADGSSYELADLQRVELHRLSK